MKETTPKMAKIILTGFPSMQSAIAAVNEGANGYMLKPVDAGKILESVELHLRRRHEATKYTEQKVSGFIETRAREVGRRNREITPTR